MASNPLLSSHQASDVQIVLHPLVLLTISDYITRHSLRELPGPIVGGLLGQHNGRDITIEHAFECATVPDADAATTSVIDAERFSARLEQFKTVHKDRKLDLVGWYTILPKSGPSPATLPTHLHLLELNDSALLLAFHPDEATHQSAGAKLPLTVYESNYEVDEASKPEGNGAAAQKAADDEDRKMEDGDSSLKLKFRELPYTVDAEESEMISMDFVARGGGNATAVETKVSKPAASSSTSAADNGAGASAGAGSPGTASSDKTAKPTKRPKTDATPPDADTEMESKAAVASAASPADVVLSREEEEMIVSLTAKANAIKMLQARINVITRYLEQLPASDNNTEMTDADTPAAPPSHAILRQIQALVSRLELLVPSDKAAFQEEMLREQNDVNIVMILNDMVQNTASARKVLRKFWTVEAAKRQQQPNVGAFLGPGASDLMRMDANMEYL